MGLKISTFLSLEVFMFKSYDYINPVVKWKTRAT
jgi:hypothetical protein